jgi:glycolate oxidase FAD binding subunit
MRTVEQVRDALNHASGPLRITGRGTWLHAGRRVDAPLELSVRELSGITEYEPGDLTLTALAGTPLSELADATRANGQFVALDPFGEADGTLGATLATASSGPMSHALGAPRDVALGIQFVTGDGSIVEAGGRVVKNVAGFDLVRLVTGSWGTLGVITRASVRLRALPKVDETVFLALPDDATALAAFLSQLGRAPVAPWCAELVNEKMAELIGLPRVQCLLLRLAGNSDDVRSQHAALRLVGAAQAVDPRIWDALRTAECRVPGAPLNTILYSSRPSRLPDLWSAVSGSGFAHATLSRGVVRVMGDSPPATLSLGSGATVRVIPEYVGSAPWPAFALSAPVRKLSDELRRRFDPRGVLNPGIFADGED